jgi:hypothetical protein
MHSSWYGGIEINPNHVDVRHSATSLNTCLYLLWVLEKKSSTSDPSRISPQSEITTSRAGHALFSDIDKHVSFSKFWRFPNVPTSMVEFHPPSNSTTKLHPRLTHNFKGIWRCFGIECPFFFLRANLSESRNTEILKYPEIFPHGFDLCPFQLI